MARCLPCARRAADAGAGRWRHRQRRLGGRRGRGRGRRSLYHVQACAGGADRSTAFQHARQGLRCNAIASGGVETSIMQSVDPTKLDQAALARLGPYHATNPGMLSPLDLANLALFLASDEARHINGAVIPADMGWTAA